MGRIVIPRVRQEARQQLQRKRRTGYFANGFGPQEMQLVSKLADLAVAGGGQIARAIQISNRERDYEQKVQSEIDRRKEAAQAEMREAQMSSGPQAFADSFFMDASGEQPLSVREQVRRDNITFGPDGPSPMRGAPIIASGRLAPEDARDLAMRTAVGERPVKPTGDGSRFVNPFDPRAMHLSTAPSDLMEPVGAPSTPLDKAAVLREASAAGIDPRSALVQEALARAPEFVDDAPLYGEYQEPLNIYSPRLEELQQAQRAAQERDFRQEAIEAVGPRPLFRIADILAAAPSARTAEQRAMLLQAAADSPDIQAANLTDLARGAYRDRAMQAVMKLFPEEEEPMSELDTLRAEYLRQQTLTSKSLQDERNARIKAAQDKADKDALRKSRAVPSRSPDDQRVFDSLMNHRRDFQSFQEGTGRYSTVNIAASLNRRFGENRQYTPEEIQTVREQLWSSRTGPLSSATDADREDLAMGMFSTRRSGKKFGGIVKGIKSSDKKAIDQELKKVKEERIAEGQEARLQQAINRELISQAKFQNELSKSDRELARTRAALGIPNIESKAGRAQFLNNYVNEQERILREKKGVSPSTPKREATPAPSGAVYKMSDIDAIAEED